MKGFEPHPKLLLILTFLFGLQCASPQAFSQPLSDEVLQFRNIVNGTLAHPCLRNKNYGVKIYSLDRKESIYEFNSGKLFTPASNLKLITTAVALKMLGPDYRFPTRLYTTGKLKGDVLEGDLYIKGFGDPKLVTEQMWLLVTELKNIPVRKITGEIIADDSYFDRIRRIKTWKSNPGSQAYNAPLGALSFNFNTVTAYVQPGDKAGDLPVVVVEPETQYIRVDNRARTAPANKRSRLIVNRVDRESYDEITVSGIIAKNHARQRYFLNITDPTNYTLHVFREYLQRAGVQVSGNIRTGQVPEGARLLLQHDSEPLSLALRGLNKFSNNFVAEQILKTLAAVRYGPPGTTKNGLKSVVDYMQSLGYQPGQYQIVDASGLSRQNRLSPQQLVTILEKMHHDLSVYPEFISALGVMGLDGNVKERMNGLQEAQRVRVKTGTLNFVSALSGYFQSLDGELFAFSILMNDLKCPNSQAMAIQDKIIREGLKFKRNSIRQNPVEEKQEVGRPEG